ncbi:MAG: radical SAM protein [Candidatus Omnitrophica bacterium]|nr:radical SAM protein [Candidatus Omnitrophota bacterium]
MAKIIFFNPSSRDNVYINTNVKVGAPHYPSLTLATLAGNLVQENDVKIIDLDLAPYTYKDLLSLIKTFKPDVVATTAVTASYNEAKKIMGIVKQEYPDVKTIIGGIHASVLPVEVGLQDHFDITVIGEGDNTIGEILSSFSLKEVKGIAYKDNNSKDIVFTGQRQLIQDMDRLPFPAWDLFEINKYKNSRLSSRKNPVGHIETSRGCAFECNFCCKKIFGTQYRAKSPRRVADELEYMLKCGFKEVHISDDSFTQNIQRAKDICLEIIKRKLKFPWSLINGVRVNLVDKEFLTLAKKAGCWQMGFGIETGDQGVLDKINKKTTVLQVEKAVKLAHRAGLDTFGFFIFGLSGETEESMKKTVKFAKRLPLDTAKFDICIPYPGTSYFEELESSGRILSKDWSKYVCHQIDQPLFKHPNLGWEMIGKYYKRAFREFYLRPGYIFRRFFRDILKGDLIYDIRYLIQSGLL